ncbi:MAG: hypothetical protein AAFO07_26570 [Bacteroidota bacterium]
MKNWFTLFLFFLSFTFLQAQIEKGTWILGGNFNASTTLGTDLSSTGYSFSIEGLNFRSTRWAIGGTLRNGYGFSDFGNDGFLQLVPTARYYLRNKEDNFKLFLQGKTQVNVLYGENTSGVDLDLGLDLGSNLMLSKSIALEFSINYLSTNFTSGVADGNLGYSAGFRWFLQPDSKEEEVDYSKAGRWLVGGSNIFGSLNFIINRSNAFQLDLFPNVGYFLNERLMVGLNSTIGLYDSRFFNSTVLGIGPNVRYYPLNVEGKFQPFLDARATFARFSSRYDDVFGTAFQDSNANIQRYQFGAGATWFIDENIALEPKLFFSYDQVDGLGPISRNVVFDVGLQFFLGK